MLPNFVIIGAAKAGTTSLYYYLKQHPEVYVSSVKEPRFFALENETLNFQNPDQGINETSVTSLETYKQLFDGVTQEAAIGEASPLYLYSPKAVERIKHYIPNAKLIVILRNPVERAYSCYTHLIREGFETLSFREALEEEKKRIQKNWAHLWHYQTAGYYHEQLKRYFDTFDRNQIKVYLYEDFNTDSIAIVQDACRFLGVDDTFVPELTRMNVSGVPKIRFLQTLLGTGNTLRKILKAILPKGFRKDVAQRLRKWNLEKRMQISEIDRAYLINEFREDILKLQNLIDRDLSAWLK